MYVVVVCELWCVWCIFEIGVGMVVVMWVIVEVFVLLVEVGMCIDYLFSDVLSYFFVVVCECFVVYLWMCFVCFDMNVVCDV